VDLNKERQMEKEVNLYVTPESFETDRIKEYLASKGIDFNVFDIHSDFKAHKRMLEATRGACGAPVIEIGHKIVCGLDRERLEETIKYELH
jgi:glutaredoxin